MLSNIWILNRVILIKNNKTIIIISKYEQITNIHVSDSIWNKGYKYKYIYMRRHIQTIFFIYSLCAFIIMYAICR